MRDQTFSAAAVDEKFATIYVAIELSKKSWLVGIQGPRSKKISQHKLAPADAAGLVALIGRQRQAFIMRYRDDLPPREIAEEMGTTSAAASSLLRRGRDVLQECIRRRLAIDGTRS